MIIDSHSHLDEKKYGSVDKLIENFKEVGGRTLIDVGTDLQSSITARDHAEQYNIWFSAGFHPHEAKRDNDVSKIAPLLTHSRCVAVGEIGLDYHFEPYDKDRQRQLFEEQIYIAEKFRLPLIIHSRDASADMLDVLRANKSHLSEGFLMHCYSESKEQAKNYADLGGYFAFGGAITFENAKKEDIIRSIPLDRLLAETDCPYLTPTPCRGEKNEPAFITHVYDKLAETLDICRQKLEDIILENFLRFFKKISL